ncbi:hypothetical protein DID88_000967 [Monilinia fructigena]|uniref:Uncharacterized protein n=1 Tax=Monilinia fructigena TaxID=38457 RepID=A0A395J439_9HELO|nr:hypothetical protein DID88_000967 [Monilinia fructigena]
MTALYSFTGISAIPSLRQGVTSTNPFSTTIMDSMRSLNTSLPGGKSPSKQQNVEPPQQLLIAQFKAAALSVTNLYKTAAADQARARAEGYQDALDELLSFSRQRRYWAERWRGLEDSKMGDREIGWSGCNIA